MLLSIATAGAAQLTGASASSYIVGTLTRSIAAGASSISFPIGDATNYTPTTLAFGAGNTAGNVTASTTVPGVPPASGITPTGSGLSQIKYINRNFTLSSSIPTADYTATFTYSSANDVVGSANLNALLTSLNNAGTWSNKTGSSVSPTVTTVTGLNSFWYFFFWRNWMYCSNLVIIYK